MQQQQKYYQSEGTFTASEVAEFEYCPLVWWHNQFEPLVSAKTETLFANLVELEHEHGPQAPSLPEYQVVEQLLLRRGAFDEGRQQHQEHAEAEAELEEERIKSPSTRPYMQRLAHIAIALLLLATLTITIAFILSLLHLN